MQCPRCHGVFPDEAVITWNEDAICPRCEPFKGRTFGAEFLCWGCGRIPTHYVEFVAAVGRIIYSVEERYEGWYCKECGLALYAGVMKRHMANTWWSARTLLFGTTVGTGRNLAERNKLLALEPPRKPEVC